MNEELLVTLLQPVLETVAAIAATALMGFVIGFLNEKMAEAKASKYAKQFEFAAEMIRALIQTADQKAKIGELLNENLAKKQFVIAEAERELASRGYPFDLKTIDNMLEAIYRQEAAKLSIPEEWIDGV